MNWEDVSKEWRRLCPLLKSKWGKLSDEDLALPSEKREMLVALLERHYGIQKKHAELQLDRWCSELKPTAETGLSQAAVVAGKAS
jgi:hypothetical protein